MATRTRRRGGAMALLLLALCLCAPTFASAAGGRTYGALAVQNRQYRGTHEIGAAAGVLPMDAFTKGITASGAWTVHFSDSLAWEVAHFAYAFGVDTSLAADLEDFDLRPTPFERLRYFLTTNLVIKPVYFKGALFNESLVRGELLMTVGAGYGWFTRSGRPAAEAGVGVRIYGSKHLSWRLDVRDLLFVHDQEGGLSTRNELWIGLGAAVTL